MRFSCINRINGFDRIGRVTSITGISRIISLNLFNQFTHPPENA